MLVESIIILAIIFFVFIISFRTKKEYAIAIIPLMIAPFVNIIAKLVSSSFSKIIPLDALMTYVLLCVIATVVSGLFIGLFSSKFKLRKVRFTYLIMSLLFVVVLELIFIADFASKFSGS